MCLVVVVSYNLSLHSSINIPLRMENPIFATYGERHANFLQSADDYHRQRHRVNKRLAKLRRSLKLHTRDTRNYNKKEKTSSISSTDYAKDPRYGDVFLLLTERDLLYSEETKLLLEVQSSKSKELFVKSKYKTALKNSKRLLFIAKDSESNDAKLLEIYAYVAIVQGYFSLSHKKWSLSVYAFSVARCIFQFLYSNKEFELPASLTKELYLELIDTLIDPALKVCHLHSNSTNRNPDLLNLSRKAVNENLIEFLAPVIEIIRSKDESFVANYDDRTNVDAEESNETEALVAVKPLITSIEWSQYTAKLKSEEVAKSIMVAQENEDKIEERNLGSFDLPLSNWQDSLVMHKQDIDRSNDASAMNDDDEDQDKYIISTFLNYNYLMLRIRRDYSLLLSILNDKRFKNSNKSRVSVLENSKNSIKISETIINSIDEIKELSGVANDDDLFNSLECLKSYFSTIKSIKLSQSYLAFNRYVESLALLNNANEDIKKYSSFTYEFPKTLPNKNDLTNLQQEISSSLKKVHVLTVYNKEVSALNSNELIIDNLNKCPIGQPEDIISRLATVQTKLLPINVKPVLFDIGYNYITYQGKYAPGPAVSNASEPVSRASAASFTTESETDTDGDDSKKRGFFGLFGGKR